MSKPTKKHEITLKVEKPEFTAVYNDSNSPIVMYIKQAHGATAQPHHIKPGNNSIRTAWIEESMKKPGFAIYTRDRVESRMVPEKDSTNLVQKKWKVAQVLFIGETRDDSDEIEELERQIAEAREQGAA